jgi:hypothetical protein
MGAKLVRGDRDEVVPHTDRLLRGLVQTLQLALGARVLVRVREHLGEGPQPGNELVGPVDLGRERIEGQCVAPRSTHEDGHGQVRLEAVSLGQLALAAGFRRQL